MPPNISYDERELESLIENSHSAACRSDYMKKEIKLLLNIMFKGKTYFLVIQFLLIQFLVPVRWNVAILAFFGFIFNYMLRVNINLTIVSMVNFTQNSNEEDSNECGYSNLNSTESEPNEEGEFIWDSVVQSQIVGSFYYGYIVTQLPGGRLSEVIGAKRVLGISMAGVALLKYNNGLFLFLN